MRPLMDLRLSTHHLTRAGLFGVAVAAAAVVFALAFVVRLLIAPISLGPFAGDLRTSLNRTLPGLAVRFDDAALKWSWDESRLNLVILGARVFDEHHRIIAQAPEAEIGLAVWPLIRGHVLVHRIALVGVQLTLVHSKDGVLRLGTEGAPGESDVLQRIRDAISKSGQGTSSLDSFAVNKARLAFLEEETGAFVVSPRATLQVVRSSGTEAPAGSIKATVDAHVEISGKPAHLEAVFNIPPAGKDLTADVSLKGLSVRALSENSKFFSFLAPFDLSADVSGSFSLAHGTQVRAAEFGIGASGTIEGAGTPLHVKALRVSGRYDGQTGRLLIDDGTLQGVQAHAHMGGSGDLTFDPTGGLTKASLNLQLDQLAVNMPGVMGKPIDIARAAIRATYIPQSGTVQIDQAFVYAPQLSAKFAGRVVLAGNLKPEIDIDGTIAPMQVRDFLRYWPLQSSPGARGWIEENIPQGQMGPLVLHTHILAGQLDLPALPENAVLVSFPVSNATVTYIHGMTPITGTVGTCTLTGDTFKADVTMGHIGPLTLSNGHGVIPNLHVRGTQGTIGAHLVGNVSDVLALMDQKPLQYPSRFKIRAASAKGTASIDMSVRVPMLRNISVDDVGVLVRAQTHGFGLALSDHVTVSNGELNFVVDNAELRAVGNVAVGSAALGIDWSEAFKPKGPISTVVRVNGTLPQDAREALGIHGGEYLSGAIGVSGELDGYRGRILRGQLKVDLAQASLHVSMMGFDKPVGTPAQAQLTLKLDPDGTVRNADAVLSGPALAARGTIRFSPTGDLQTLDVPYFRSGPYNDFALSLMRDPVQGTTVTSSGHSFDAQPLLHEDEQAVTETPSGKAAPPPTPYHINSHVDRVVMRDGVVLTPFSLNISGLGNKVRTFSLTATQSKTAEIRGTIVGGDDGGHLKLTAGDAGLLLKGLFGSNSLRGGTINIDATIPAAPLKNDEADYSGKLAITNFNVVDQPFLTRLFAAGSFGGLSDLLRGKGIGIDRLDAPFSLRGEIFTVRDAQATGPSLGLTGDGYYDTRTNQLALQGVFTPLYGINGIMGSIPVLGSVLGSKKGEGLIGVTYSASGNADNPNVSVNPLSMLMPGILRRALQGNVPSAPTPAKPPTPLPKPQQSQQ